MIMKGSIHEGLNQGIVKPLGYPCLSQYPFMNNLLINLCESGAVFISAPATLDSIYFPF